MHEYLLGNPLFLSNVRLLSVVLYLIAHHDDTNYQYPSVVWHGYVHEVDLGRHATTLESFEEGLSSSERDRLSILLRILQIADAWAATGIDGATRTYEYSLKRGLAPFGLGNPLNAWCWEESAIGNVRIAAKRAIIDAPTPELKHSAIDQYDLVEQFVERVCREERVEYHRETVRLEGSDSCPQGDEGELDVKITRYESWPRPVETLKEVALLGDKNIRPYSKATVRICQRSVTDLHPTSFYILKARLRATSPTA